MFECWGFWLGFVCLFVFCLKIVIRYILLIGNATIKLSKLGI